MFDLLETILLTLLSNNLSGLYSQRSTPKLSGMITASDDNNGSAQCMVWNQP
jgi:hypothetical protein